MLIVLKIQNVFKHFGGLAAVSDVSLDLGDTRISGLIGPNGSGKSTLFHLITGFYALDAGDIRLNGQRISGLPPFRISRKGLVRTFQQTRVLPLLSVLDNLVAAAPRQTGENLLPLLFTPGKVRAEEAGYQEKAKAVLERIRLDPLARDPAGTLSYGQQKLLELGRVLMADPRLILLDEPTAGINPSLIRDLLVILRNMADTGIRIFLIEHNMPLVAELCEQVFVMDAGRLISSGTPEAVRHDPRVIEAYLGRHGDAA